MLSRLTFEKYGLSLRMLRRLLLILLSLSLFLATFFLFKNIFFLKKTPLKRKIIFQSDLGNSFNILLIANDARLIERKLPGGKVVKTLEKKSRSDIIDVIHINLDKGIVNLVNIPRDMLVSIPGYTKADSDTDFCNLDKINHSYFFGKDSLLKEVLLRNFQIPIHRYLTINFFSFQEVFSLLSPHLKEIPLKGHLIKSAPEARRLLRARRIWRWDDIDRGRNSLIFLKEVLGKIWPILEKGFFKDEVIEEIFKIVGKDTDLTPGDIAFIFENLQKKGFQPKEIKMATLIGYQAPVYLNRYGEVLACYLPIHSEIKKQIAHFIFEEEIEAKSYMENEPLPLPSYVLRSYSSSEVSPDSIRSDLEAKQLIEQSQEF